MREELLPSQMPRQRWFALDNGVIYAELDERQPRAALVRRLTSLTAAAIGLDYGLHSQDGLAETLGMLKSGRHLAVHHARIAEAAYRGHAFDVAKPFRAAAFAGIRTDPRADGLPF